MIELDRFALTNAVAAFSMEMPASSALFSSIASTPSDSVGPGRTAFTVTPLPATRLARPREIARHSCSSAPGARRSCS
jgi:hypothetical protein